MESTITGDTGFISERNGYLNEKISKLKNDLHPISFTFNNREEIETREKQIVIENAKLNRIEVHEKEITDKLIQNKETKTQLLAEYKNAYNEYTNIIGKLNERGSKIEGGLRLKGSVKFDSKTFNEKLKSNINLANFIFEGKQRGHILAK